MTRSTRSVTAITVQQHSICIPLASQGAVFQSECTTLHLALLVGSMQTTPLARKLLQ
jgi:hypothetical protein